MLHFYGILALEKYERNYRFIQKGCKEIKHPEAISYNDEIWTMDFHGSLVEKEKGENLLLEKSKFYENDREYLIALYSLLAEKVVNYISRDSFLLLDNGKEVYIHNNEALYCERDKNGDINLSSDSCLLHGERYSKLKKHSSLLFYNNNLKTL